MTKAEALKRFEAWADDKMRKELARISAMMQAELSDICVEMMEWKRQKVAEVERDFTNAEAHARQQGADDVCFINIDDDLPHEPTTFH